MRHKSKVLQTINQPVLLFLDLNLEQTYCASNSDLFPKYSNVKIYKHVRTILHSIYLSYIIISLLLQSSKYLFFKGRRNM